ncbi:MAG: sugar transferase [Verrucomicrobiota bacterium]
MKADKKDEEKPSRPIASNQRIKRLFDVIVVSISLLIAWPLFLMVGLLVWFDVGFPIIFRQRRPGLYGRAFTIYKFRTMRDEHDLHGEPLADAYRMTRIGKWLRSTSLDEIPELMNVLKGEMSLVGPRPLLTIYLERYSKEQARRHNVLPGLTGWAQIHGRNARSWPERLALDVWYVDHHTLALDIRIILVTFWKVIRREDINQPGRATVDVFPGNK